MSRAQTASGDSGPDEIEEKGYNDLQIHVAEETEYKATGDIDTLRQKARGGFEPKSKTTARTASKTLIPAKKKKPPSKKTRTTSEKRSFTERANTLMETRT